MVRGSEVLRTCDFKEGVLRDPTKVKAVLQWESLKTIIEIRSFLGLVGYYRIFFEGFSKIAMPLT